MKRDQDMAYQESLIADRAKVIEGAGERERRREREGRKRGGESRREGEKEREDGEREQ